MKNLIIIAVVFSGLFTSCKTCSYVERQGDKEPLTKDYLLEVTQLNGAHVHTSPLTIESLPEGYRLEGGLQRKDTTKKVTTDGAIYLGIGGWKIPAKDTAMCTKKNGKEQPYEENGSIKMIPHELKITGVARHTMPEDEMFLFPKKKYTTEELEQTLFLCQNDTLDIVYATADDLKNVYDGATLKRIHPDENKHYYRLDGSIRIYFVLGKDGVVQQKSQRDINAMLKKIHIHYTIPYLIKTKISSDKDAPVIFWRYDFDKHEYRLDFLRDRNYEYHIRDDCFFIKDESGTLWKVKSTYKDARLIYVRLLEEENYKISDSE